MEAYQMRPAPLRPAAAPATPQQPAAAQPQRYLTNDEAAEYLRLSPRTLAWSASAAALAIVTGMGSADISENGFALGWDEVKPPPSRRTRTSPRGRRATTSSRANSDRRPRPLLHPPLGLRRTGRAVRHRPRGAVGARRHDVPPERPRPVLDPQPRRRPARAGATNRGSLTGPHGGRAVRSR